MDRIFAYLKNDPGKGIVYSDKHGLQLMGFVDSDFAGCEDSRRSTTGWVFTLAGGPISWSSQRQKTVATLTMDAEYIAGAEAAKEAVWIRNFINDLRIPGVHIDTVPLYIDNNSALKLTRNPEFHSRSKHIDVKHHFIREKVDEGVINTQRVDTKDNLADVFTKALPRFTHEDLVNRLNLLSGGDAENPGCVTVGDETTSYMRAAQTFNALRVTRAARQTANADRKKGRKDESRDALNKSTHQAEETSLLGKAHDGKIMGSFWSATDPSDPWHRGRVGSQITCH